MEARSNQSEELVVVACIVGAIVAMLVAAFVLFRMKSRKVAGQKVLTLRLPPTGNGMLAATGLGLLVGGVAMGTFITVAIRAREAGQMLSGGAFAAGLLISSAVLIGAIFFFTARFSQGSVTFDGERLIANARAERYVDRVFELRDCDVRFWGSETFVGCDIDDAKGGITFNYRGAFTRDFELAPRGSHPGLRAMGFSVDAVTARELFKRLKASALSGDPLRQVS